MKNLSRFKVMNKKYLILTIVSVVLILLSTLIIVLTVLLIPRISDRVLIKTSSYFLIEFNFLS